MQKFKPGDIVVFTCSTGDGHRLSVCNALYEVLKYIKLEYSDPLILAQQLDTGTKIQCYAERFSLVQAKPKRKLPAWF